MKNLKQFKELNQPTINGEYGEQEESIDYNKSITSIVAVLGLIYTVVRVVHGLVV
jgi:hypothetical protein